MNLRLNKKSMFLVIIFQILLFISSQIFRTMRTHGNVSLQCGSLFIGSIACSITLESEIPNSLFPNPSSYEPSKTLVRKHPPREIREDKIPVKKNAEDVQSNDINKHEKQPQTEDTTANEKQTKIQESAELGKLKTMAQTLSLSKKYSEVVETYKKILELQPDNFDIEVELAKHLSWTGRHSEAISLYDKLVAKKSDNIDLLKLRAAVIGWNKEFNKSIEEYNKILALSPNDAEAKLALARVLSWNKEYKKSISVYRDLLNKEPNNALYHINLADVLKWSDKPRKARREYEYAAGLAKAQLEKNSKDIETKHNLAIALTGAKKIKEAKKIYYELINEDKDNHYYYFELGNIYNQEGKRALTKKNYELSLEKNPYFGEAKKSLDKIHLSQLPSVRETYSYSKDSADTKISRVQTLITAPAPLAANLGIDYTRSTITEPAANVRKTTTGAYIEKSFKGDLTLNMGLKWNTPSAYAPHLQENNIETKIKITNMLSLGTKFRRYALDTTHKAVFNGILSKENQLDINYLSDRGFDFYGNIIKAKLSDANSKKQIFSELNYKLNTRYCLYASHLRLNFSFNPNNGYWSPKQYIADTLGFRYAKQISVKTFLKVFYDFMMHGENGNRVSGNIRAVSLDYRPKDKLSANLWLFSSDSNISQSDSYSSFQAKTSLLWKL